eukprot:TRINITY_DN9545_c0_g1_i1.p1 TRINITY_DN9545_c0_g1~~TRINITY_DN9545_c0_g1_i1.p1  ORF type:complete len:213 (+),score=67.89 TRINITY_DN9545_c0_g1_i1:222-860(+)
MADLERWYTSIPIVTRVWVTLSFLLAAALSFEFVSPFDCYLNIELIKQGEVWRLLTSFIFFGAFDVTFFFSIHFVYQITRRMEEHHYHRRTSRFLLVMIVAALMNIAVGVALQFTFTANAFVETVVYLWSRRNPDEHISLLGIFTVSAPYLPFVMGGLGVMMRARLQEDLAGMFLGHIVWYVEDIAPRILKRPPESLVPTPAVLRALFSDEV